MTGKSIFLVITTRMMEVSHEEWEMTRDEL